MEYNLKKIKKSLFVTLLVFTVPALSIFPSTNSKYITERDDWLKYVTNMKPIKSQKHITVAYEESLSTYDKAVISFNFPKSDNARLEDKDIYNIEVNENCVINEVNYNGKTHKIQTPNNKYQISYQAGYGTKEDTIRVKYTCSPESLLDNSGTNLVGTIKVTESFNEEGYNYKYMDDFFTRSYSEYQEKHPEPTAIRDGDKLTIPSNITDNQRRYTEVEGWLVERFGSDENSVAYLKYFYDAYSSNKGEISKKLLDGLSVENKDDGTLVYTIEKNYKNYALTKYVNKPDQYHYFYFMGELNDLEKNDLFIDYIKKYVYPESSQEYNRIIGYVNQKGGIKSFMDNSNSYIQWNSSKQEIYISSFTGLLDWLASPSVVHKSFNYNKDSNISSLRKDLFKQIPLSKVIDSNGNEFYLDGNFYNHFSRNMDLALTLNTCNETPINKYILDNVTVDTDLPTGEKYFNLDGTDYKLLVRVYSTGIDAATGIGTNGVEIILVEDGKDYNLEFTTSDTYESVNEILGIVKENLSITETEWNNVITNAGDVTVPIEGKNLTITKTGTKININVTNAPATVSTNVTEPTEPTTPTEPTEPTTETDTGETNTNEVEVNNTN